MNKIHLDGSLYSYDYPDRNGTIYTKYVMDIAIKKYELNVTKKRLIFKINKKLKKLYGEKE